MCAWIRCSEIKYSQLKINHLNDTPSTKADGAVPSTKAVGGGISVVCLTRTSRYCSKRRSWLVPLLPTFILSWLLAWSRITQARFAGRGQNSGCVGRGSGSSRGQGRGHGTGYTSKPKTRTRLWAWDGYTSKPKTLQNYLWRFRRCKAWVQFC